MMKAEVIKGVKEMNSNSFIELVNEAGRRYNQSEDKRVSVE